MKRFFSDSIRRIVAVTALCVLCGVTARVEAAPVFSVPGFVDEEIYLGNGMISMAFDPSGNLLVTEKQGRVLFFEQNSDAVPLEFFYEYYEGTWTALPDFESLTPVATGTVASVSLAPSLRNDNFALRFTGQITVPADGEYTFYTRSDDGSRIFVNGNLVVNHDGLHGATEASGSIALTEGEHTLRVEYFEAGGGEALEVSYAGPGIPKQALEANTGPFLAPTVFLDIASQVNADGERGLLGFALDPDYAENRYLYLLFSTSTDQRIVRYTANEARDAVEPGSEWVLLSGLPNATNVHKAGDIGFRPGEPYHLYVMLGDDGNRYLVGDLSLYHGKLLRIDSSTGLGVEGNPYYAEHPADSVQARIWAIRFRNPFRFVFDPADQATDAIFVSENGDGTDRLVRIAKGADGGWDPLFLTSSQDGLRTILDTSPPSRTAIAFLRGGPFAPDGPVIYNARYGGDAQKEVRRWRVTGSELNVLEPLPEDNGNPFLTGFTSFNIVSFLQGPDGALYFTDSNQGASLGNGYRLGRIRYVGGSAPVAAFSTAPAIPSGNAPLAVTFTDTSTFADHPIVQWAWDFGDGSTASVPSPQHLFTAPGVYPVTLTVTDQVGLTHSVSSTVTVTQPISLQIDATIFDASNSGAPSPLAGPTELRFYQSDGVTPLEVTGGMGEFGNAISVTGGAIQTTVQVGLTGNGMVVSVGEPADDGMAAAFAGFAIPAGVTECAILPEFRLAPTLIHGRVVDTLGRPATADVGIRRGNPSVPYATNGGRDFLQHSGRPASNVPHRMTPDDFGYYHIPIRDEDANSEFTLDTTADTGIETYGRVFESFSVTPGAAIRRDVVLGLLNGGSEVDDLSGISPVTEVDFIADIQPIFSTQCIGCHNDIATNSGGLDLQSAASLTELVNAPSVEAPGVKLVAPGRPDRSYLMEKISSDHPQVGTRMRPGDPMAPELQALIRDWILQLPTSHPHDAWQASTFQANIYSPSARPAADYSGDGVTNLFSYAFGTSPFSLTPSSARPTWSTTPLLGQNYLTVSIPRAPGADGLEWIVEATSNLSDPSSWNSNETLVVADTPNLLVVRDTIPMTAATPRFLRVRITLIPEN